MGGRDIKIGLLLLAIGQLVIVLVLYYTQQQLTVNKLLINYSGPSDHIDTVTDGGPYSYNQARESTQVWSFGLGISHAL